MLAGAKAIVFAFIDDWSRTVVGWRWGQAEDNVRLEAAFRRGLESAGLPRAVVVDRGSAFGSAAFHRTLATLGIRIIHSRPSAAAACSSSSSARSAAIPPSTALASCLRPPRHSPWPSRNGDAGCWLWSREAHLLQSDRLEDLRMLGNDGTSMDSRSPAAFLLVGQPTLRRRMRQGNLAAVDQRVTLRVHLDGIDLAETAAYLKHNLALAGRSDTLFSDDALAVIQQASWGCPARSTTSPSKPWWPPSARTRTSSTGQLPRCPWSRWSANELASPPLRITSQPPHGWP